MSRSALTLVRRLRLRVLAVLVMVAAVCGESTAQSQLYDGPPEVAQQVAWGNGAALFGLR
jgi:hypothetical protein